MTGGAIFSHIYRREALRQTRTTASRYRGAASNSTAEPAQISDPTATAVPLSKMAVAETKEPVWKSYGLDVSHIHDSGKTADFTL
jgi:hypothetical protein